MRTEIKMFPFSCLFNTVLEILNYESCEEKNGYGQEKKNSKYVFVDDVILSIKDPKNSTGNCLQVIKSLIKTAEYKANIHKSVTFLYTNDKCTEKGTWETHSQSLKNTGKK